VTKRKPQRAASTNARLTATEFRSRLYGVLDEVAETGTPYEVVRGEQRFLIVPADPPQRRLSHLPKRPFMTGTLEELAAVSFDWEPPAED